MRKSILFIFMFMGIISAGIAQERTITRFQGEKITEIEAHGAFNITIRQGKTTGATVNIPVHFEKQLIFTLDKSGKLVLAIDGNLKTKKGEEFTAEITCSSLEEIELSGACTLEATGKFEADEFEAKISGASKIKINGEINVKQEAAITLSGASKFSGQLTATAVTFETSGASDFTVTGKAGEGKIIVRGVSKVNMENFLTNLLNVNVSGASAAYINASENLTVTASGVSKIIYTGDPRAVEINASGVSSIKKK